MPLYEYQCMHCSTQFEIRCSSNDESAVTCPKCHGEGQRMFSPVSVIFKGSGFYTTDNRKNGSTHEGPTDTVCS
ncbi:FmdB family zinc ribbon protein [Chloroflexota bacterium]